MTDWSAGTFDGAERSHQRAVAQATPAARLDWLEEALRLAAASGALGRERAQRQRDCEQGWAGGAV